MAGGKPHDLIGRSLRAAAADARVFRRSLALLTVVAPRTIGAHLTIVALSIALPLVQVWLAKLVVNAVVARSRWDTLTLAVFYGVTLVAPSALGPAQAALTAWLEERVVAEVDRRMMAASSRLTDLVRVERPAFQDELHLLRQVNLFLPRLFSGLQQGGSAILTLGGLLILLVSLHPALPLALAVATVPHLVMVQRLLDLEYRALARGSRSAREMDYCARIATEPAAAKEVRVFALGAFFLERFQARLAAALAEVGRARLAQMRLALLFGGLHALALAGGFWYVASQATAGRLTPGDLALYVNAVAQVEAILMFLPGWGYTMFGLLPHARGFFHFLDTAAPSIALPPRGQGYRVPADFHFGIEFRRVRFHYPESAEPVLHDVSFLLPAGKVTAVVGANGAGKSTLVKLLTRMYDPEAGDILLNGTPLREYHLASLRSRIAVVYQDSARLSLTLRENIAVGAVGLGGGGSRRVEEAAELSGADKVAQKLPQRYDTELTRRFQGGVELSGGEWQKVVLARGFMRDAALVILDEPTSALDAEAEQQLFNRFREIAAGRTALVISHRLSTARTADQIVVLEGGCVVEIGSHVALMALGGRYAELFEIQASRYV